MKKVINEQLRDKNDFVSPWNITVNFYDKPYFRMLNGFQIESTKRIEYSDIKHMTEKLEKIETKYIEKLQKVNDAFYSYYQTLFLEFENEINKQIENEKSNK